MTGKALGPWSQKQLVTDTHSQELGDGCYCCSPHFFYFSPFFIQFSGATHIRVDVHFSIKPLKNTPNLVKLTMHIKHYSQQCVVS